MQPLKTFYFFNPFFLFSHDLKKSFQHIFVVFFLEFYGQILSGISESQFFLVQNQDSPGIALIFFQHFFNKIFCRLKSLL